MVLSVTRNQTNKPAREEKRSWDLQVAAGGWEKQRQGWSEGRQPDGCTSKTVTFAAGLEHVQGRRRAAGLLRAIASDSRPRSAPPQPGRDPPAPVSARAPVLPSSTQLLFSSNICTIPMSPMPPAGRIEPSEAPGDAEKSYATHGRRATGEIWWRSWPRCGRATPVTVAEERRSPGRWPKNAADPSDLSVCSGLRRTAPPYAAVSVGRRGSSGAATPGTDRRPMQGSSSVGRSSGGRCRVLGGAGETEITSGALVFNETGGRGATYEGATIDVGKKK
jgi:hypothetical protein